MDSIVELIEALAWPVAAVWIGYMFKGEFRQLLTRVSHLRYKDIEAKFERELSQAEAATNKLIKFVPKELNDNSKENSQEIYFQLSRITETSPRAAIMEAWVQIEIALTSLAGLNNLEIRNSLHGKAILDGLAERGFIPKDSVDAFQALRKVRNEAAHSPDFVISQNEAERYIAMALKILKAIDKCGRNIT